ncbi:hypothetical protein BJF79_26225 [Actinomadura sp. CNU-125]|nr:hypothetical protein BJF79_26225 [Actinomadura sp. CNU-125]
MAAVAGATALAVANASDLRQERIDYTPSVPVGSTLITPPRGQGDAVRTAVERELPGVPLTELRILPDAGSTCPGDRECPMVSFQTDPYPGERSLIMGTVVGGAAEARMLLGRADRRIEAALAAGEIVLFGVRPPPDGTTTATVSVWRDGREAALEKVRDLPATAAAEKAPVEALVPPAAAERIGVAPRLDAFGIDRDHHRVTEAEQARLAEVVAGVSKGDGNVFETGNVRVERGFGRSNDPLMLALAAAAAVLALGGALIAIGLSAAAPGPTWPCSPPSAPGRAPGGCWRRARRCTSPPSAAGSGSPPVSSPASPRPARSPATERRTAPFSPSPGRRSP